MDGILLKGIDTQRDVSQTRKYIVEGNYDLVRDPGSLPKIVLGRKLASRLSLHAGDKVAVFGVGQGIDRSQMKVMQFMISGIYESGMSEYDDVFAFTDLADGQKIFQCGDAVTGLEVLVANTNSLDQVADSIQELLGYPYYARTMYQTYRNLFSWIELQKKPIPIILGLVTIVATVNIIGTLLMMVLDKTRDIGVLMSIGATRWVVARIFLRQGLVISAIGTFLGNALALAVCSAQMEFKFFSLPSDIYFMSSVPVLLRVEDFLLVSVISIGLSMVCALIPARLASRLLPVNAIRFA